MSWTQLLAIAVRGVQSMKLKLHLALINQTGFAMEHVRRDTSIPRKILHTAARNVRSVAQMGETR